MAAARARSIRCKSNLLGLITCLVTCLIIWLQLCGGGSFRYVRSNRTLSSRVPVVWFLCGRKETRGRSGGHRSTEEPPQPPNPPRCPVWNVPSADSRGRQNCGRKRFEAFPLQPSTQVWRIERAASSGRLRETTSCPRLRKALGDVTGGVWDQLTHLLALVTRWLQAFPVLTERVSLSSV